MQGVEQLAKKNNKAALNFIGNARLWPETLGAGKPYEEDIDSRLENYMEGIYYEKTRNATSANEKWNAVVNSKAHPDNSNNLLTALALRKLNRQKEGEKLLIDWTQKDPDNKVAQWSLDIYSSRPAVLEDGGKDENFRIVRALIAAQP